MRMSEAFPEKDSKHLKAADLMGRQIPVSIADVQMELVGDDTKPVLYFEGKVKGMVINRTNNDMLVNLFGDETDNWIGQVVVLYAAKVMYAGQPVQGLRIRPAPQQNRPAARPPVVTSGVEQIRAQVRPATHDDMDDSVPF